MNAFTLNTSMANEYYYTGEEGLPIDSLPVDQLTYEHDTDLGSLGLKKLQIIYRSKYFMWMYICITDYWYQKNTLTSQIKNFRNETT